MVTGAVTAMAAEARWLAAGQPEPAGAAPSLRIRTAGTGYRAAREAAGQLLAEGATRLMSWGVAGGLDPRLKSGTLLLPEGVAGSPTIPCDADWREQVRARLPPRLGAKGGRILSRAAPVTSVGEKRRLGRAWDALAVDQESRAVAEAARFAGVPFLVLRAIVDPAHRPLPEGVTGSLRADGSLDFRLLLRSLAEHPGQITALPGLARDLRRAGSSLRLAARLLGPGW